MVNFTIAIPTYNGGNSLHYLLDALLNQTGINNLNWEVIVADNNSTDNTAKVVSQYQSKWQSKWPRTSRLKYLLEPEQGAGFARNRAARAAKGELIGFLDDDVIPASTWIANAYRFGQDNPQAGIFSGQIHGKFAAPPPKNFQRIQGFLAVREHGPEPYPFDPDNLSLPTGAAFVARRAAWVENVPDCPVFVGRVDGSMVGGEDLEPMLLIHKAGWETWYTPTMHAYHQIPKWRLEKAYLKGLMYAAALCTCQLRMLTADSWFSKAVIIPRMWLGNSKRLVKHLIKHRQKVKTEAVPACELAFLLGNLVSPFYFLKLWAKKTEMPDLLASEPSTLRKLQNDQ